MPHARHAWIDALRLAAGISMVGLHASSDAFGLPYPEAEATQKALPLVARAFLYTARTELFILISLFLLLMALDRRPRPYGATIAQQARRLLIPFLFWTAFYALWNLQKAYAFGYHESYLQLLATPSAWLGFLLLGESKYHMHFLPTLFAIALAYPLYRCAIQRPWLGLAFLLSLALKREADQFLWPSLESTPAVEYLLRAVKIATYGGYGLLAGAAYGLFQRQSGRPWPAWTLPTALLIGWALLSVKLWHTARIMGRGDWDHGFTPGFWADFTMPAVLLACAMLFAHRHWPGWISRLAPYSFGLYLCHPIFLDLAETASTRMALTPNPQFLFELAFSLPATGFFVLALSRLKSLAWTVGLGPLPRLSPAPFHRPNPQERAHV